MSIPQASNPLLNADDQGDQETATKPVWIGPYDASVGQSGNVWFLAETYWNGWTVKRDAKIPAGKALCVPLRNMMLWGWPDIPEAELWNRMYLAMVLDTAVVSCEIDGVAVKNLGNYRSQTLAVPFVLGDNNLPGLPAGEYGMAAAVADRLTAKEGPAISGHSGRSRCCAAVRAARIVVSHPEIPPLRAESPGSPRTYPGRLW